MNTATFLDAGRADCSVLCFDTSDGKKIIVIDGGTKFYNQNSILLDFLKQNQVKQVDLLVLTHLHQDHFGGFYHLINNIPVKTAVIPYGDIVFNPFVRDYYINHEFFSEYHKFYQYLEQIKAKILRPEHCADIGFLFGEFYFSCLYPQKGMTSAQKPFLDRLCSPELKHSEAEYNSTQFRALCNEESSIWLLQKSNRDIILFSGDCTADTMDKALSAYHVHPKVLKLSHHGFNSRYFTLKQLMSLKPKEIIISNSIKMREVVSQDCLPLIPLKSNIIYTWNGNYTVKL